MTTLTAVDRHPSGGPRAANDDPPGFAERWAAWQAKGAEHDARIRHRLAVAVAVVMLLLIGGVVWLTLW